MVRVAQIISTGRNIPEKVITNDDLNTMLGEKSVIGLQNMSASMGAISWPRRKRPQT